MIPNNFTLNRKTEGLCASSSTSTRSRRCLSVHDERGQTTAEYALVLLAAGTIAMLVVAWAQNNDAIGGLFDTVLERITGLM